MSKLERTLKSLIPELARVHIDPEFPMRIEWV
jgi:hypothetical protein